MKSAAAICFLFLREVSCFHVRIASSHQFTKQKQLFANAYDEWRSDLPVDTLPLEVEFVDMVLDEIVNSDEGLQMFGVHDRAGNRILVSFYL